MNKLPSFSGRRKFLHHTMAASAALTGMMLFTKNGFANPHHADPGPTIIGPREGYGPQTGTLVSEMNFCRFAVLNAVKDMTTEQLDFLLDDNANSIGALLYHLAATDAFYHENTINGFEWDKWDEKVSKKFGIAMELGEPARKSIKGNNLQFYTDLLTETRERTLASFRKKDDPWLMSIDQTWPWGPTNNYCKWFHVCEHESHHQGQIALIKSRIPGLKK